MSDLALPPIPSPTADPRSYQGALLALKQRVEGITRAVTAGLDGAHAAVANVGAGANDAARIAAAATSAAVAANAAAAAATAAAAAANTAAVSAGGAAAAAQTTANTALANAATNTTALATETTNRTTAEGTLTTNLAGEVTRATTAEGLLAPKASPVFTGGITNGAGGPTWTQGSAAPAATAPVGSLYSRVGGAVGATLYVSRGAGVWAAVAGV